MMLLEEWSRVVVARRMRVVRGWRIGLCDIAVCT